MTTAVFVDQETQQRTLDDRQELVFLTLASMAIVATGVLLHVATAGLLTAGVLMLGSIMVHSGGSSLGLLRTSVLSGFHLLAVVAFAFLAVV